MEQLEELQWRVMRYQKKCQQQAEEIAELRADLQAALQENGNLVEKLRLGIKRGVIQRRDSQGNTNTDGIPCVIEIHDRIGEGTSRKAYRYSIISAELGHDAPSLGNLRSGVIKYYNPVEYSSTRELLEADCTKLWYLSDISAEFNNACGLRVLSFVDCAKVELDNGEMCTIEPLLEEFEVACNNDGDGWENLDDRLSCFAHYVFEKSNGQFVPCDFQGDLSKMLLTDPEINCADDTEFCGIPTRGKVGAWRCLEKHFLTCSDNKFCNYLKLNSRHAP